jgi:hypothetical protein
MPTKQELLAEAYSRGILPPEQASLYEEGLRRGIIAGAKTEAQPKSGLVEDVANLGRGFFQGATLGFGDEITSAIGAGVAAPFSDKKFSEIRKEMLDQTRAENRTAQKNSPIAYGAGQVGGGTATGIAAASAAPVSAAPTLIGRSLQAAGAGAVMGGVQGTGEAEGNKNILSSTVKGAGIGAAGGVAGQVVGEKVLLPVARVAGSSLRKAGDVFKSTDKNAANALMATDDVVNPGRIQLTKGDKTQDVNQQAFESEAERGARGKAAQEVIAGFRQGQEKVAKENLSFVAGKKIDELDEQSLVNNVMDTVRGGAREMKKQIDEAYEVARAQGRVAFVDDDAVRNSLQSNIRSVIDEGAYNVETMPEVRSQLKRLAAFASKPKVEPSKILGPDGIPLPGPVRQQVASLNELENWRKGIVKSAQRLRGSDPSQAKLLTDIKRQYDKFVVNLIDTGLAKGDPVAIKAYQQAIGLRARYGRLFEDDQLVSRIISSNDDKLTTEEAVNLIYGAGALNGNKKLGRTGVMLIRAAGQNGPQVKEALASGAVARVFNRSVNSNVIDPVTRQPTVMWGKLNSELKKLSENRTFYNTVFSPEQRQALGQLQQDVAAIASKQPGAVNHSNTATAMMRMVNSSWVARIPGVAPALNAAVQGVADSASLAKAMKSVAEIIGKVPLSEAMRPGIVGQQISSQQQEQPVPITQGNLRPLGELQNQFGMNNLTPEDQASALPNEKISRGKAKIDELLNRQQVR